ncbi:hypothetical protein RF11_08365 [Thelohanellus kitauei]|uniref:Uncharacterized protein n=1 Tax=Thelohanellus kitauei TaxID=669202 RepID=A0A0C2IDA9_THEKT|nr:hypothetical protein RF11_08365 [Thelohanellus kitauei]
MDIGYIFKLNKNTKYAFSEHFLRMRVSGTNVFMIMINIYHLIITFSGYTQKYTWVRETFSPIQADLNSQILINEFEQYGGEYSNERDPTVPLITDETHQDSEVNVQNDVLPISESHENDNKNGENETNENTDTNENSETHANDGQGENNQTKEQSESNFNNETHHDMQLIAQNDTQENNEEQSNHDTHEHHQTNGLNDIVDDVVPADADITVDQDLKDPNDTLINDVAHVG